VRLAFGARYTDLCYGYMGFWRDVLAKLDGPHAGFEVETMMHIRAHQHRLRITEVPSYEALRISGTSNLNAIRDGWAVLRTIMKERFKSSPRGGKAAESASPRPVAAPSWVQAVDLDLVQAESEYHL
jgi:hypothetical protein